MGKSLGVSNQGISEEIATGIHLSLQATGGSSERTTGKKKIVFA